MDWVKDIDGFRQHGIKVVLEISYIGLSNISETSAVGKFDNVFVRYIIPDFRLCENNILAKLKNNYFVGIALVEDTSFGCTDISDVREGRFPADVIVYDDEKGEMK